MTQKYKNYTDDSTRAARKLLYDTDTVMSNDLFLLTDEDIEAVINAHFVVVDNGDFVTLVRKEDYDKLDKFELPKRSI